MAWFKEGGWFHRSRHHVVVRSTGRAIHHTSKAVHRLLLLGMGVLVVTACLLAGASWRLAQGPIDLRWLSDRLKSAFIDDSAPVRVSFDGVFLVWEGFHKGADYPLDVRLSDIVIADRAGHGIVAAPSAHLTFSLAGLLLGRFVPRALEVDHARIEVTRDAGGGVNLGGGPAGGASSDGGSVELDRLREQLSRPVSSDYGRSRGLLDQIHRVHFRNTAVTLRDRGSGLVVRTPDMDIDLVRAGTGHVRGVLRGPLQLGGQTTGLAAEADWTIGLGVQVDATLTSFRPSGVGALPPALAFLGGIDLPVSLTATVGLHADLRLDRIQADVKVGQGQIQVAQGSVPIRGGSIALSGTSDTITVTKAHFDLAHTPAGNPEIVDIAGSVVHKANRLSASGTIGLSRIDIADLPRLWPLGVGGGARPWVTENVTAGMVTRGSVSFTAEADDALHDVVLTKATGDLDGTNATFTWIDHVPPVEQTDVHLHLVDPDTLDIRIASAHQHVSNADDLLIKDGQMRITGLSLRDQVAVIRVQVQGPVASALALLKEPRLHLLSAHPIGIRTDAGDVSATLDFRFPLDEKLQIDDVRIHADAHLDRVRLLDVVGGQNLDGGVFDMSIDKDGLTVKGQGSVAKVPVSVDGSMDFTAGPASQIVQKVSVIGQPSAAQLVAAGLPVGDFLDGSVPMTVVLIERRGGDGSVSINGDLTRATLSVHPLAWVKPSGTVANASVVLLLSHDRLTKADGISVRGDGVSLTGSADFDDGQVRGVTLGDVRLGQTRGRGSVRFAPNGVMSVALQGDQIDLSAKLTEKTQGSGKSEANPATTPAWTFDARFDHAILANGEAAHGVRVTASGGGGLIRLLDAGGVVGAGGGFSVAIQSSGGGRHLLVDAKDAGSFLLGMDVVHGMRSGHLAIDGVLDTPLGLHPLVATATIDNIVIKNSPALGKLLQAITLYGLVDALRGPGMGFTHIIVPFRYDGSDLHVDGAQAFNSSLGLTATGRIGVSSDLVSMTGTIVPAYFFNSMLGNLPLVGKLFSPEKGGGVFAARFGLDGKIDDPTVSINPISALTPGFLRGIFGVFDRRPK